MPLHFPNTSRPKTASKHLSRELDVPLSTAQRAVARSCGYRDWYELEHQFDAGPPFVLDEVVDTDAFVERQARLIIRLARELSMSDGDVQYALASIRLTGNRPPILDEQIAIRIACWRASALPNAAKRERGAVGVLNVAGRNGEPVILRQFDRPTSVVSHREITTVADFEYLSPRTAPDLFLPMRLYMPYGIWTETDGSQVVFSRDYKPMWRLRTCQPTERLVPWLHINFVREELLWPAAQTPWTSENLSSRLYEFLNQNGLQRLPVLADALPLLVYERTKRDLKMSEGADLLKAKILQPAA